MLAAFPMHDYDTLNKLQTKWLTMWCAPWNQRFDEIKDYYGERIGFYFLYIGHYNTYLMVPAFVGAVAFIGKLVANISPFIYVN